MCGAGSTAANLIDVLADAMIEHGIPEYIRSDNGPEFVAKELRKWLARTGAATLYIEPGSPWENGYCESFNWGFTSGNRRARYYTLTASGREQLQAEVHQFERVMGAIARVVQIA